MVNIISFEKSASKWTQNDLLAYNIRISQQTPETFYGQALPTVASLGLDPNLLSATLNSDMQDFSLETYTLLQYLNLVSGEESTHDYAKEILRVLRYDSEKGSCLRSRYTIPLFICGESSQSVQTDVCLVQYKSSTILMVSAHDSEPQVIASAIASYQHNNEIRTQMGLSELDAMTIPCVTLIGTRPVFYLVPVTRDLSNAVITSKYPISSTVVKKCVVAPTSPCLSDGMEIPEFRQVALQHYTAFRALAKVHWSAFMI